MEIAKLELTFYVEIVKLIAMCAIPYFTVRWSLKKFFKEKRWEKKAEAYSSIIESLHHMKTVQSIWLDHTYSEANLSDELSKNMQ